MALQELAVQFDNEVARAASIQERSAVLAPDDPAMVDLAKGIDQILATIQRIITSVESEQRDVNARFEKKQPRGWVSGQVAVIQHRSNWMSANHSYEMTLITMRAGVERVRRFRALLAPAASATDGTILCSAGHHNHSSRDSCGVCGLILRSEPI